jgi:hypothetical protein
LAPGTVAIADFELAQRTEETPAVLGSLVVQDALIERHDRRPLKLGSHSTHDEEINPVVWSRSSGVKLKVHRIRVRSTPSADSPGGKKSGIG